MKMRALKMLTFVLTIIVMTSSTAINAETHKHCLSRENFEKFRAVVLDTFRTQYTALNDIYAYQGASTDPNPEVNGAVAGNISTNRTVIVVGSNAYYIVLRKIGVSKKAAELILIQNALFVDAALEYALDVNLANAGQPAGDQYLAASNLMNAAKNLGKTYEKLTGNPIYQELFEVVADYTTEAVQANRRVLNANNEFGAEPANAATETAAAVSINVQIQELVKEIALLIAHDVARGVCPRSAH